MKVGENIHIYFMLLEYQLDWIKIVDFLLIAKFWASPNNLYPPSRSELDRERKIRDGGKLSD